ncbi:Beta-lactamase class C and other penicillin binding protein [Thermogutta terrifontis]|uniref:Beta-lactamase class C and other penicillin binding protein n=1 Tax=Thermogutta terrifontis TaxID=1331910 RepID=A0A286RKH4_9BACT|nr:Beta-lactamase class C and other penicillin binding protein [Thermogutta terrifontis]
MVQTMIRRKPAGQGWHIILYFSAVLITCSFLPVRPALGKDDLPARLEGAVRPFIVNHQLAGCVMVVADKHKIIHTITLGWADVDAKRPMQADTLFWIASQSKPITATALMILVDEGRVQLDDPVEKYLPEFRGQWLIAEAAENRVLLKRPSRPITVRDILSHTSGLPFRSALEVPTLDVFPLAARVRSYAMTPLEFDPGRRYQYSNAGINTAARIVEVVTGKRFEEFLKERIFEPLGMKDTTFWPDKEQLSRLARAYRYDAQSKELVSVQIDQLAYPLDDRQNRYPVPAGGLFSTAADLVKSYQMLLNNGTFEGKRLISEDAVREMTSRQTRPELDNSYGLGFVVNGPVFGHGGSHGTNTLADRRKDAILVWLVQHAGPEAQEAFRQVDQIFSEWSPDRG